MNPTVTPCRAHPPTTGGAFDLAADWCDFVLFHFTVPPELLAPCVPFPLDERDGRASVSLVSFRFARLRPARGFPNLLGRLLLRPFSDHEFLNLRTYVRGPLGRGIHFLAEWINNPLSLRLGPLTYGLPYRLAHIRRENLAGAGLRRLVVEDRRSNTRAVLVAPARADRALREAARGSMEEFLFERHLAYTSRRRIRRVFAVEHAPWRVAPFQLARFDSTLIEAAFPWFRHAAFVGGHFAADLCNVHMSRPHRVATRAARPLVSAPIPVR